MPEKSQVRRVRLLLVDDDQIDRMAISRAIRDRKLPYDLQTYGSIGEARESVRPEDFDIALIDFDLRDGSGLELIPHLGGIPSIIVTGTGNEKVASEAMRLGAYDYVVKDIERSYLKTLPLTIEQTLKRVRAERRFQVVFESSPTALVLVDAEGKVVLNNPHAAKLFGYSPGELLNQSIGVLLPDSSPADGSDFRKYFLTSHAGESDGTHVEFELQRKDGSTFPAELAFSPIDTDDGDFVLSTITDITNRYQRIRQAQELDDARRVQQSLFPTSAPELPGFDIAGAAFPAEETSGDYFDFLPMSDGAIGLVIADVSGHGMGPALIMVETRAYLRSIAIQEQDVGRILARTNELLARDVSTKFVTALLARLDPAERRLVYAAAGHVGCLLTADGQRRELESTALPLGVVPEESVPVAPAIQLATGDIVLLATDGIDETFSPDREMFGQDRVFDVLQQNRDQSASEIVASLHAAAREFAQGAPQKDDITAIVIKVGPPV